MYTEKMLVVLHIFIAVTSLLYATALYLIPGKFLFSIQYLLVGLTLASGTYLLITSGAHILQACLSGVAYLGFVSILMVAAHERLARQRV